MRILHTGDNHFSGQRLSECVAIFEGMINYGVNNKVDYWVIAGDLLDKNTTINSPEFYESVRLVKKVADYCPLLIVRGNHDPKRGLMIYGKIKSVHPITIVDAVSVLEHDGLNILCLPYTNAMEFASSTTLSGVWDDGAQHYRNEINEFKKRDGKKMVVCHLSIRGAQFANSETIVDGETMLDVDDFDGVDYTLLGHIHNSVQEIFAGKMIRYCGVSYRTRFDERGRTGFQLWDTEKNTVEYIDTYAREMIDLVMTEKDINQYITFGTFNINFPEHSDIRLTIDIPEGKVRFVDKEKINSLCPETSTLKIVLRVNPKTVVRAPEITKPDALRDKIIIWGKTYGVNITEGIIRKADLVQKEVHLN